MAAHDDRTAALAAAARAAWPGLAPAVHGAVAAAIAQRLATGDALTDGDAAEIAMALGCAAGDAGALAGFDRDYCRDLGAALGRFRLDRAASDEVVQRLRERMLLATDGAPPRLVRYAGRGLRRVVAVAAARIAIDRIREQGAEPPRGDLDVELAASRARDPELELLHRTYAGAVKAAFEAAIAELPARDRTALRLHLVDGLSIDEVAALYALHRASVARRIEAARDTVARATRRHLRAAGVDRSELEAAYALVASQLDLSIERVLRDAPEALR